MSKPKIYQSVLKHKSKYFIALGGLLIVIVCLSVFISKPNKGSFVEQESQQVDQKVSKKSFQFTDGLSEEEKNELAEWHDTFIGTMYKSYDGISIIVQPYDPGFNLIMSIIEGISKRYTDAQVRDAYFINRYYGDDELPIVISLFHNGDVFNHKTIRITDAFYEYFFIENEEGEYVKPIRMEKDNFVYSVSNVSREFTMVLFFSENEVEELGKGFDKLYLTFDGLDISPEDRYVLEYPFSKYYEDQFPKINSILDDVLGSMKRK